MEEYYLKKELYDLVKKEDYIFDFLQSGSLDGIWYWDLEKPDDEWMSSDFWLTLGYDPEEMRHKASEWQNLIFPEDRDLALENFRRHSEDPSYPYDQVVRYHHKDGSVVWIRCRGIIIRDEKGTPLRMLGAHTDLTAVKKAEEENRALEERLFQSEKMQAIGMLAGGVAHDFNNQLTGIMGYCELILSRVEDGETRTYIKAVMESAENAASLTNQLLTYARKGLSRFTEVSVRNMVDHGVNLFSRSSMKGIRVDLKWNIPPDLVFQGDGSLIQNAVLNLLINSRDAIDGNGTIRIESYVEQVEEGRGENEGFNVKPGSFLCIAVSDSGQGMEEDVKRRIFEPFFTTKGMDGTGMGLAAVYGTILKHDGFIEVDSEPGEGTEIRMFFPLDDSE